MKRALTLLLALEALAGGTPVPLEKAYAGSTGVLKARLLASSVLERDPWSKGEWAPFRTQQVEWEFRLSYACEKGTVLEAVLEGFRGRWMDRPQGDPDAASLDLGFAPAEEGKAEDAWGRALQGFSGTRLRIELDPSGGVRKVSGMTAAAGKLLGSLPKDPPSQPLADEMRAWFTDEAWKGILGAAFPNPAGGKARWSWPLPWPAGFEEKALPRASLDLKASGDGEEVRVEGALDAGKIDETLQFPLQPGYHSLGTEQKGRISAVYGPRGLKAASVEASAMDRWDNYRPNSKADRFTRTASITLSLEAVP